MINNSINLIRSNLEKCNNPVVLSSFGKDSIVLLDLVKNVKRDVDVIFFKEPFFQEKLVNVQKIISNLNIDVYDYPPSKIDYIMIDDYFETLNYYSTGDGNYMVLFGGCTDFDENKKFQCVLKYLSKPIIKEYPFRWDCIIHGHKESDNIHIEKINISQEESIGNKKIILPLKDWKDEDIWRYIKENNLQYDKERYDNNNDNVNPDKNPTCHNCLDYRKDMSYCPLIKKEVKTFLKNKEQNYKTKNELLETSYIRRI